MNLRRLLPGLVATALLAGSARADTLEELLAQARAAKDAASLKALEPRLQNVATAEDADKLLAALLPPHAASAPVILGVLETKCKGPAAIASLQKLAKSPPPWFSGQILQGLCRMGDENALKQLVEKADDGRLKQADRGEYVRTVCDLALKGETGVRKEALAALGVLRVEAGLGTLLAALTDTEVGIRGAALSALHGTMDSLFPYVWFEPKAAGYDVSGGTDEARRRAVDAIRNHLIAAGIQVPAHK
jgi:hypothetical protein